MNQLPAIAFEYHRQFESLHHFLAVNRKLLLWTLLTWLLAFGAFAWSVMIDRSLGRSNPPASLVISIVASGVAMVSSLIVSSMRDRAVIREVRSISGDARIVTIERARSAFLTHVFARPPTEFLSIAESVRKSFEFAGAGKGPFGFRFEDVVRFIYDPDSKARLLSLFLAAATLTAGLTLFDAETREYTVAILSANSSVALGFWLTAVMMLTTLCGFFAIGLTGLRWLTDAASRRFSVSYESNPALVRYLVRDLAKYHAWPGPSLRRPIKLPAWAVSALTPQQPIPPDRCMPYRHYMERD